MHFFLLALAQLVPWYLFPGTAPKDTAKVPQKSPELQEAVVAGLPAKKDTATFTIRSKEFSLIVPDEINIALALPLGTGNGIDFYCGALLAARELGSEGRRLNIRAVDADRTELTGELMAWSDIFIGPFAYEGIKKALGCCPEDRFVISPLEPRTDVLADSLQIIQTPTRLEDQLRDLARWSADGLSAGESIVLVLENEADTSSVIKAEFDRMRIPYKLVYGYASARNVCDKGGTRFITGSSKEYFVSGLVRTVSVLALEKNVVSVYCPSKVRSYENLNVELLHNANAHIASTYFVDYSSPSVKQFVYSYRALFKAEPNSFAFHGYDTVKYFTDLCAIFGREWYKKITDYSTQGLQTGFRFESLQTGIVNCATKRIVYSPDFSISVQ